MTPFLSRRRRRMVCAFCRPGLPGSPSERGFFSQCQLNVHSTLPGSPPPFQFPPGLRHLLLRSPTLPRSDDLVSLAKEPGPAHLPFSKLPASSMFGEEPGGGGPALAAATKLLSESPKSQQNTLTLLLGFFFSFPSPSGLLIIALWTLDIHP